MIRIDFSSVDQAAYALRLLKSKISSRTIDTGLEGTKGEAREQIDVLVNTLKETQQSILELVTNSQEALAYLSEAFLNADNDASILLGMIGSEGPWQTNQSPKHTF